MENSDYAESGGSSARSRDPDFESPRPCDDQNNNHQNYKNKVKFMCSYGGKILPRPHDNQLSYVGGQTKILAVDRFVKFASVTAKLTALCEAHDVCFKYQLPGEDLDALISVTNDDDLEHMMHEYDRLNKGTNSTTTTVRLRLFLFPVTAQSPALTPVSSFSSDQQQVNGGRIEKEKEVVVDESDLYMVQAPGSVYHAPIATPVTGQVNQGQGYYVQTMPTSTEVYHEQQVYNVIPPVQAVSTQQTTVSAQQQFLPQGYCVVQSTTAVTDQGYGQVAYDNGAGRQIYYTTTTQGAAVVAPQQQTQQLLQPLQPTVVQQYQAMAVAQENAKIPKGSSWIQVDKSGQFGFKLINNVKVKGACYYWQNEPIH
ncbi:Phox/Bem1p [Artemisia annua]|uniref:Phox/Bem1p n=1 Tax=Artemisia annua TaxID=35608 RepID=A0A2U1NMI6_ARTAN|nr:Phox/Bem1p [Artemisia annua]